MELSELSFNLISTQKEWKSLLIKITFIKTDCCWSFLGNNKHFDCQITEQVVIGKFLQSYNTGVGMPFSFFIPFLPIPHKALKHLLFRIFFFDSFMCLSFCCALFGDKKSSLGNVVPVPLHSQRKGASPLVADSREDGRWMQLLGRFVVLLSRSVSGVCSRQKGRI